MEAVVSFGHFSFGIGSSLFYYRQLIAHLQRTKPQLKPFLEAAWELINKWESLEPVQHRPPLPEPILHAMMSVGLAWRWDKWVADVAGLTLGVYAGCRIGEVLKARRRNHLTPSDLHMMMTSQQTVYLNIVSPKSRRRGAKVQYATFTQADFLPVLLKAWGGLSGDQFLYPGSPSVFRTRWNRIVKRIGVSLEHKLTPGFLRAGGAVAMHRAGIE